MRIDRNPVDSEYVEERDEMARDALEEGLEYLVRRPQNLVDVVDDAEIGFACAAVLRPDDDALYELLRLALAANVALFEAAAASTGTVDVELAGRSFTLPATGPSGGAHARNWRWGFRFAVVDRDRDALDRLTAIPVDVIRASTSRSPEYSYLLVQALQAFWRKDPATIDRFLAVLEATDPDRLGPFPPDFALRIIVPELELWLRFLTRDQEGFDEALDHALVLHRKYWGTSGEQRRDPEGWVATGPLALACLAHDAGMSVSTTSPYLPERLVRGT